MASTYSTNLKIELIGTGEQSGTWGNTTNTNLGTLIEEAIAGYVTQAVTDGAATVLTIPNGASSNGRNYVIELTGALTANRTVEVPAVDKPYIFFNNTTGGYSVTVKVSGQTGVTIANGKKAIVYTNSTDVIEVVNAPVSEAGTQTLSNKTLASPTVTGVATFAAGTVSAPALTTTGDTNTGIFFPAADTIAFTEGGAESMRIDSSGNVGIGTSSPAYRLQVVENGNLNASVSVSNTTAGTSSLARLIAISDAGSASFGFTSSSYTDITAAADSLLLNASNASGGMTFALDGVAKMKMDSSGNVGIGTSSPGFKLEVVGGTNNGIHIKDAASATVFGGLFTQASNMALITRSNHALTFGTNDAERMRITSSGDVGISGSGGSATNRLNLTYDGGSGLATVGPNSTGGSTTLTFGTSSSGTYAERMRIASTGNVGIGGSPSADTTYKWLNIIGPSTSGGGIVQLNNSDSSVGINMFCNNLAGYMGTSTNHPLLFRINSSEAARISATGGFSVGTTSDPGAGAIYATGNITAYFSDDRLKVRKGNIENALAKVEAISGFHYEANETAQALGYKAKPEVGVSAQEVQAILPEVVVPAPVDEKYLTVHYERLVPLLIEAVKELSARVKELEAK